MILRVSITLLVESFIEDSYYKPSIKNVSFSADGNYIYIIYIGHGNVASTIRTVHKYSLSIPFDIGSTLTDRGYVQLAERGRSGCNINT